MIYQGIKGQNYQVQKEVDREARMQKERVEKTQEIKDMEKCDVKKPKEKNKL